MRKLRRAKQERVLLFASIHFALWSFCFSICNTRFSHMSEESLLGATTVPSQLSLPDCSWGLEMEADNSSLLHLRFDKIQKQLLGDVRIAMKVNQPLDGRCCMTSFGWHVCLLDFKQDLSFMLWRNCVNVPCCAMVDGI